MIILSIDPATHGCGCALWIDGRLFAAGYVKNPCDTKEDIVKRCATAAWAVFEWVGEQEFIGVVDTLVFELPQVYPRGENKTKGDPNKVVLPLAMVDSSIAALFPGTDVYSYQPHAWKKGSSKPKNTKTPYVIAVRVKIILTPNELVKVDWSTSVEHSWDVADGLGVGLFHLRRFERFRVLARD